MVVPVISQDILLQVSPLAIPHQMLNKTQIWWAWNITQEQAYSGILLEMVSPLNWKMCVIHKVFTAGCTHTQMCSRTGKPPSPSRDPFHTPYSCRTSVEFGLTKKWFKSFTEIGSEREYCKTSNIFLTWIAQSCSSKIYICRYAANYLTKVLDVPHEDS